jgi:hypothetical protein
MAQKDPGKEYMGGAFAHLTSLVKGTQLRVERKTMRLPHDTSVIKDTIVVWRPEAGEEAAIFITYIEAKGVFMVMRPGQGGQFLRSVPFGETGTDLTKELKTFVPNLRICFNL